MRRTLRLVFAIAAGVIGIIVLIPVISALSVVGTDDQLASGKQRVHNGAYALAMDEQIVPFAKTTATLHASSDKELFIGTANGVDTDSYLTGVAHEEITSWSVPGSMHTRYLGGDSKPQTPVASRDWWTSKDTGKQVSRTFDLGSSPRVIVIAPADGKGDIGGAAVSVDVQVKGVLAFSLIGLAIVVLAWGTAVFFFIRWRNSGIRPPSRRIWARDSGGGPRSGGGGSGGRRRGGAGTDGRPGGLKTRRGGAGGRHRSEILERRGRGTVRSRVPYGTAKRRWTPRTLRRSGTALSVTAVLLAASACSPLPVAQPREPRSQGYSRVAMQSGKAGDFMSDYVGKLNKSLAKNGKGLDAIQAEPLLSRTSAEQLVAKAHDKKLSAGAFDSVLAGSPAFTSYPMWFMAFATVRGDDDTSQVLLARRESAAEDWKVVQSLFVPRSAVPKLSADSAGAVGRAPGSHSDVAGKAAKSVTDYLGAAPGKTRKATGVKTAGNGLTSFRKYVDALATKKGGFKSVKLSCKNADVKSAHLNSMSLHTGDGRGADGGVSTGEATCELTATASSTASVDMGKDVEALISGEKNRSTITIKFSIPYLLTTRDGKPTVAADGWFMVSAKTTGKKTQGNANV